MKNFSRDKVPNNEQKVSAHLGKESNCLQKFLNYDLDSNQAKK